ncbi:MAG: hypothetical protein JNJ58_06740 [Chitinophagaceae bacterium]|nr:hypothetical protein [Chitinophagaceae bacterium]
MKMIFLFLLLFPLGLHAQFSFDQLAGKWEETHRTNKKKKVIETKDVVRFQFRPDGYTVVRHQIGPTYMGDAQLNKEILILKSYRFDIVSLEDKHLVIREDDVIYHLQKVEEFANAPVVRVKPEDQQKLKPISNQSLAGKWTCYKKTDGQFSKQRFYLKVLNLKTGSKTNEYYGTMTRHNMDSVYSADVLIEVVNQVLQIKEGTQTRNLNIQMLLDGEMVLEEESATYYLKQLGKE